MYYGLGLTTNQMLEVFNAVASANYCLYQCHQQYLDRVS